METPRDSDSEETAEWLDSLDAVIDAEGIDRAHFILENLLSKVRRTVPRRTVARNPLQKSVTDRYGG